MKLIRAGRRRNPHRRSFIIVNIFAFSFLRFFSSFFSSISIDATIVKRVFSYELVKLTSHFVIFLRFTIPVFDSLLGEKGTINIKKTCLE